MKITPDHLARGAFIYAANPQSISLSTIMRAGGDNMVLPSAPAPLAGLM